jgi:hypothetical protein
MKLIHFKTIVIVVALFRCYRTIDVGGKIFEGKILL